ncbi:MAG: ABC transporter substrate-binding protein, partial [Trueperaceae bacterium]
MKRKLLAAISATLMAMVMTVGLAQSDEDAARRGGVLNVAYETEPVTLDMMYTTTTDTLFRMTHAFEGLFTYNEGYQIVPMLVDTYQLSEDGTVYTLTLRQGITFHDGSPLTSADAVASVLRYTQMTSTGREVRPHLASVDVVDDLTFTITLTQPFGGLLAALAYRQAIVLPAAVIEEVGTDQIRAAQAIGTG